MEFLNLTRMTVEVSVLIILITLVRSLFQKKCNPNIRYFLWIFVALRVLLPFKLDLAVEIPENWELLPFSAAEQTGETGRAGAAGPAGPEVGAAYKAEGRLGPGQDSGGNEGQDMAGDGTGFPVTSGIPLGSGSGTEEAEASSTKMPAKVFGKSTFILLWLCGVIFMIFYIWLNNRKLHRILKAGRRKLRGLPGGLPLYAMHGYNCLAGILSPAIYVDLEGLKDPVAAKHVICHELQHYRVRDNYWQLVRVLCLILQWHNPFMWWAYSASKQDCELACDARVVRGMSREERCRYGSSLLSVLECAVKKQSIGFQTSMGASRKFLAERMQKIVKPKSEKRTIFSIGMIVLTGMVCFLSFHVVRADAGRAEERIEKRLEERAEGVWKKEAAGRRTGLAEEGDRVGTEAVIGRRTDSTEEENRIEAEAAGDDSRAAEVPAPTKEEVLAAREQVLEGMSQEAIERLKENVKVANQKMEWAWLYENLFQKLEDKESLYWNYFDKKGEIQIGWAYDGDYRDVLAAMEKENISKAEFYARYGTPVMDSNRFDAENFIALFGEMKESVKDEKLREDLQQMMDETALAAETHEVEHVLNIYRLLHDMDYYLLRYGMEDVGKYVRDTSLISTYYGVLSVYE